MDMVLLEVEALTKKYKDVTAVEQVSFQVAQGEIVALIGENGAGKSTILNCLQGSIAVTKGNITYKSKSLTEKNAGREEFGFLIQADFFDYMNAYDNLDILLRLTGQRDRKQNKIKIMELLRLVGLEEKWNQYVKTFSFGMKQRLGLAQALIYDPGFLVLDEPFVGLDPIGKKILKKIIREKAKKEGGGILFSSHDLEDVVEICDRVVMLKKGTVVYNDVFHIIKRYIIRMGREEDAVKLAEASPELQRKQNDVLCGDYGLFQQTYRTALDSGMDIRDVEIRKDDLYQLFEGGDGHENSGF